MNKYKKIILIFLFMLVVLFSLNKVKATERYEISTKEELIKFAEEVNSGNNFEGETVYLMQDIDLSGDEDNQWTPIGNSATLAFTGIFEGNGHIISGIYISDSSISAKGLFGYNTGIIRNLGIESAYMDISKCDGSVNVGAIAGTNDGTIYSCYNSSNIDTSVNSSHAYTYIGGIVGAGKGTIQYCYNVGNINVTIDYAVQICMGTIIGHMYEGAIVENCYNIGNINAEAIKVSYLGVGMIGHNLHGTVSNCYYLKGTSEKGRGYSLEDEEGIIESKNSDEIKSSEILTKLNGESDIFISDSNNINSGYPILYWQTKQIINKIELVNIQIKNPPEKTSYIEGERINADGMVVVAAYTDGSTKEITTYTLSPQEELTTEDKYIIITYTEDGITKTVKQEITVETKDRTIVETKNNTTEDDTISKYVLPNAGISSIILILIIVLVSVVINKLKLKKYEDL